MIKDVVVERRLMPVIAIIPQAKPDTREIMGAFTHAGTARGRGAQKITRRDCRRVQPGRLVGNRGNRGEEEPRSKETLVLQAGLEELVCRQLFNFFTYPHEGIDQQIGILHCIDRHLTFDIGHPDGVNIAIKG